MKIYKCKCVDCGNDFQTTSYRAMNRSCCVECGLKRVMKNAKSLKEHQGEAYDKWKHAIKERIGRL